MIETRNCSALSPSTWPRKVDVFGIEFSVTNYQEIVERAIQAARNHENFVIDFVAVDTLTQAASLPALRDKLNTFEAVCPDGHPVRIAMNHLHDTRLRDRVCGPDTTAMLLKSASESSVPVYFYGSTPHVITQLQKELASEFPELQVAGMEPSIFRPLTDGEKSDLVDRINGSGARLIFIGLGSPLQSHFAHEFKGKIKGGLISVGAAFDFLAKNTKRAPLWMRNNSLEWLFRLSQEPKRLFKRYTTRNAYFVYLYCLARLSKFRNRG